MKCSLLFILLTKIYFVESHSHDVRHKKISIIDAFQYMRKFEYIANPNMDVDKLKPEEIWKLEDVQNAVLDFQCTWGLKETGNLDDETVKLMISPRCGMPDDNMRCKIKSNRRRKRYTTTGTTWPSKEITYKLNSFTNDLSKNEIRSELSEAFKMWTDVSNLEITEKTSGDVDMDVEFLTGDHDDGSSFDGPGGVLAHAFMPDAGIGGDLHFDDEERYTKDSYEGINLLWVAAHEGGHALGLGHSNNLGALMAPFYQGYKPNPKLTVDDIAGIQFLYGAREEIGPIYDNQDEICEDSTLDAMTRTKDGTVYAFKNKYVYKVMIGGYEKSLIKKIFPKVPNKISTAVYNPKDGLTLFIKGTKWIAYLNTKYHGKGELEKAFKGIPKKLDSMFYYPKNGYLFITVGNEYYRLIQNSIDDGFPKSFPDRWLKSKRVPQNMLPNSIDTAFVHPNGRLYFFNSDKYFEFNTYSEQIRKVGYTNTDWFNCKDNHAEESGSTGININVHDNPNMKKSESDMEDVMENVISIGDSSLSTAIRSEKLTSLISIWCLVIKFF